MRILVAGRGFDAPGRHVLGFFELDQARALRDAGHDVRFAALDTRSIRSAHWLPIIYLGRDPGDLWRAPRGSPSRWALRVGTAPGI